MFSIFGIAVDMDEVETSMVEAWLELVRAYVSSRMLRNAQVCFMKASC